MLHNLQMQCKRLCKIVEHWSCELLWNKTDDGRRTGGRLDACLIILSLILREGA